MNVFFSWQSDGNNRINRNLLEGCIAKACGSDKLTHLNLHLDLALRNELGSLDIADSIFKKISNSSIYICDVSVVLRNEKRNSPNPNVLVELGYASAILGWEKVICVMNTSGGSPESLPFDIRGRRILTYQLAEDDDESKVRQVKNNLVSSLTSILKEYTPNLLGERNEILKYFVTEPHELRMIAIHKPDKWNIILLTELLRFHLEPLKEVINELKDELVFIPPKRISDEEFYNWFVDLGSVLGQLVINMLSGTINDKKIVEGTPKEIRDCVVRIKNIGQHLINWETELRSFKLSNGRLTKIQEEMKGWGLFFCDYIFQIEDKTLNVLRSVHNDEEVINIKIEFATPNNFDSVYEEISKLRSSSNASL